MNTRSDHQSLAEHPRGAPGLALRAIGLGVIVAAALVRLTLPFEPMPYWDADPSVLFSPSSAIGPAHSLMLDVVTWLGAAVGLAGSSGVFTRRWWLAALLALIGIVGAVWHGLIDQGGNLDDLRIGSTWAAAVVGALATLHLAREERLRRLTLALLLGAIGVLALKGAVQLLVEHPTTLAMYRQTREQFLQSQGWSEGSSAARGFERRLGQPEATGWFALSNVYASVAAAIAVALCGVTVATWKKSAKSARAVLVSASLIALAAEVMSMSKGGGAALVIGLGLVLVVWFVRAQPAKVQVFFSPRFGGLMGALAVAGALAAVVARGLVGDRLGELSLLFRWFYMQGAARIFASHPANGVGPAGFKDAYLIAKPPISPEEVTSPHSVLFDWAATLGLTGLAWAVLWVGLVCMVGARLFKNPAIKDPNAVSSAETREDFRVIALMVMVPTMLGAWFDTPAATIDSALVRVGGAVLWITISLILSSALRATLALSMVAAGAIALAAHGQIEVTPIWPGTACWVLLLFAAVGAPSEPTGFNERANRPVERVARSSPTRSWWTVLVPVAALAFASVGLAWFGVRPVWAWQTKLVAAAELVRPLAEFRQRIAAIGSGKGEPGDSPTTLARDLSRELGRTIGESEASVRGALATLNQNALTRALEKLRAADYDLPAHPATLRAASKIAIQLAASSQQAGDERKARELADLAEELSLNATTGVHEHSTSWSWLGTLRSARATMLGDPSAADRAIEAWLTATTFDPYGLSAAVQLAEAYQKKGDATSGAAWARKALELDANTRLDPLKGLSEEQRASLVRLADRS